MKKICSVFLVLVILVGAALLPAGAVGYTPSFEVYAEAAYIVNLDTNIIVYEKESETPMVAASLVKMMTCILMLESYQDQLDSISVASPAYIYDILYGKNASTADIRSGETVTLRQLLYAMLLPSGNEAAYMVADYMGGGSIDNFVARMNSTAQKLGCTGTVFTDPCGLDEGNMITARDAYLILRYAMSFDAFVEACGTPSYYMGENPRYASGTYYLHTTNKMLPGANGAEFTRSYNQGGKTGTLGDWQNFAGWHTQNGETYISVVLHSPDSCEPYDYPTERPALYETGELMDWIYDTFSVHAAFDISEPLTEIPVKYSTQTDSIILYPADGLMTLLPIEGDGSESVKIFDLPESVAAPIKAGDVIGTVTLQLSGQELGTVDLIATTDVARNDFLFVLAKIGEFFSTTYFKVFLLTTLVLVGCYAALYTIATRQYRNSRRQNKRR